MAIIGIDLGTTNSLAAVWKDGISTLIPNALGQFLTPSIVFAEENGSVWAGAMAKEKLLHSPDRGAASFKRHMGTEKVFHIGNRRFTPQELSSLILKQLKQDAEAFLGEPVEEAVISVPAYFNDEQRYATREAGLLAGLKVERLVNEPSAAALACRMQTGEENSEFLVIDFGGGTLDVSVVECFEQIIEIQAVSGDNHLGGNDFDQCIAEHFCREHHLVFEELSAEEKTLLLKRAEQCKRALTGTSAAMMEFERNSEKLGLFLTQAQLIEICAPLLTRLDGIIRRAMRDARKHISDIDQIVLVGGSCRMPAVQQYIATILGKKPYLAGNPDETVALGVGIYAGIKERKDGIKDVILTDICPFTLGVGVLGDRSPDDLLMSPLIERNSVLPVSKTGVYTTTRDFQSKIIIRVFQGESMNCRDNLFLGSLELPVPPARQGMEDVLVRFTYDINGILQVEVQNRKGETAETVIVSKRFRMSGEELNARVKELQKVKLNQAEDAGAQLLIARGERLYTETTGRDRETIVALLKWFSDILKTGGPASVAAAKKKLEETFDYLENQDY